PGVGPRILLPRFVAEFAGRGNGAKHPQPFAGADVEASREAGDEFPSAGSTAERGADDDDVSHHRRWRGQRKIAFLRCPGLLESFPEINDAVAAEGGDWTTGFRIELNELVAERDVDEPIVTAAVGPVRQTASARATIRRSTAARSFVLVKRPERLAGGGIGCDDVPRRSGGEVQDAANHQRRHLPVIVGPRPEVFRLPARDQLEIPDVSAVDLTEWRVVRGRRVAAPIPPFTVLRGVWLRGQLAGAEQNHDERKLRRREPQRSTDGLSAHGVLMTIRFSAAASTGSGWPPTSTLF